MFNITDNRVCVLMQRGCGHVSSNNGDMYDASWNMAQCAKRQKYEDPIMREQIAKGDCKAMIRRANELWDGQADLPLPSSGDGLTDAHRARAFLAIYNPQSSPSNQRQMTSG